MPSPSDQRRRGRFPVVFRGRLKPSCLHHRRRQQLDRGLLLFLDRHLLHHPCLHLLGRFRHQSVLRHRFDLPDHRATHHHPCLDCEDPLGHAVRSRRLVRRRQCRRVEVGFVVID